jgi:hypothetical protein
MGAAALRAAAIAEAPSARPNETFSECSPGCRIRECFAAVADSKACQDIDPGLSKELRQKMPASLATMPSFPERNTVSSYRKRHRRSDGAEPT